MELLERRQKYFLFEANVGAGLPVIVDAADLIASGDEIVAHRRNPVRHAQLPVQHASTARVPFSTLVR